MGASKTGPEARMSVHMVIWEVMSGGIMGVQGSEGGEGIGRLSIESTGAHAYSGALGNGVDHTSEIAKSRVEASGAFIHHIPSIIG